MSLQVATVGVPQAADIGCFSSENCRLKSQLLAQVRSVVAQPTG